MARKVKEKKDINEIKSKRIDSRPFAEISDLKIHRRSKKKKRVNRSRGGDIALFLFLALFGCFSAMPLISTLDNFSDLVNALGSSLVPFSRYFFNTIMVTIVGTFGHIIISSMCAYPLAKYKVPGGAIVSGLVVYSLMFPSSVTSIPNYMVLNWLGLIDTYWSVILPAFAYSMGLFLMKQFMTSVPTSLIEAAKIDGATEFKIYYSIVMPLVKPAWVTLIILLFQSLWSTYGSTTIYREDYKMVSYALSQIATAGAARQGTLAAVSLIMIIVPIGVFVISQSQVMETMAHSGMK